MTNPNVRLDLTRPIIGIENRTAQEVFDMMCDRIRYGRAPDLIAHIERLQNALKRISDVVNQDGDARHRMMRMARIADTTLSQGKTHE